MGGVCAGGRRQAPTERRSGFAAERWRHGCFILTSKTGGGGEQLGEARSASSGSERFPAPGEAAERRARRGFNG